MNRKSIDLVALKVACVAKGAFFNDEQNYILDSNGKLVARGTSEVIKFVYKTLSELSECRAIYNMLKE